MRRENQKLSPRYFGPYEVTEKVGHVAYRLKLPLGSMVHPVFHVSMLKGKVVDTKEWSSDAPIAGPGGEMTVPESILERRMVRSGNSYTVLVKVRWLNLPEQEASWENFYEMEKAFPEFMARQQPPGRG